MREGGVMIESLRQEVRRHICEGCTEKDGCEDRAIGACEAANATVERILVAVERRAKQEEEK